MFTIITVGLTAFGVGWHQKNTRVIDPTVISQKVLASPVSTTVPSLFPLSLELARDRVKLGQYQNITITTAPFAELDIVTIYPNGSINNPQTLKETANELGRFEMKYKLSDFQYLGVFQVIVQATSGDQEAKTSKQFVLQTWINKTDSSSSVDYIYPLLP